MNISKSAPEQTQASSNFSCLQFFHQPHSTVSFQVTLTSSLSEYSINVPFHYSGKNFCAQS